MSHHLSQLDPSHHGRGRHGIRLINDFGEIIEGYDVVFRELFCLAAAALGHRLHQEISSIGLLWDEILPTGSGSHERVDLERGGLGWQQEYAPGSLIFLVRRVDTDAEAQRLVSSGHCFAHVRQVCDIIRCSMQIQSSDLEAKLSEMAGYAKEPDRVPPGVHLGFFAVRPRVKLGFEVLVRKGARNLLPSTALPIKRFETWQVDFLKKLDGLKVPKLLQRLAEGSNRSPEETTFAIQLSDGITALGEYVQEPFFEDAAFVPTIVRLSTHQAETVMIALRLVIPIHAVASSPNCELVPLGFFRMRQVAERFQQGFMEGVHREFWPILKTKDTLGDVCLDKHAVISTKLRCFTSTETSTCSDSVQTSSEINLCSPGGRSQSVSTMGTEFSREKLQPPPPSYGGIMVSQEITIKVEGGHSDAESAQGQGGIASPASRVSRIQPRTVGHVGANVEAEDNYSIDNILSFVDIFFAECVKSC